MIYPTEGKISLHNITEEMNDTSRYNSQIHHRRSIRLKGYDYSKAGLYFITICTQDRACLFGKIVGASLVDAKKNDQTDDKNKDQTDDKTGIQTCTKKIAQTMILNDSGKMIETEWLALPKRFTNIELHEFVVMPNHFHGILEIVDIVGASLVDALNMIVPIDTNKGRPQGHVPIDTDKGQPQGHAPIDTDKGRPQGHAPTNTPTNTLTNKTVGDILDAFKSITTVEYIHGVKQSGWNPFNGKIWQRNYYEHIIRDEQSYQNISNYIINNPAKWKNDKFYNQ